MDFFKSVFSEDPSPPSSPKSDDQNQETHHNSPSNSQTQNPNPKIPSITSAWTFGSSLFKTIATKSESVIENYKKDIEEFSSGLRKETEVIRQSASRAVQDLPSRLESGAAVAQTSLESVGQAIDTLGFTVSNIIIHGKDSILNADNDDDDEYDAEFNSDYDRQNLKPYSRIDAVIRAMQCDMKTYCDDPVEHIADYNEWKMGFLLEEKSEEIKNLFEENNVIGDIFNEVVPGSVDQETFWSRYFYKVYRVKVAEEARANLVKRAIEGHEEEDLSWDVDEDDDDDDEKSVEKTVKSLKLGDGEKEIVAEVNKIGGAGNENDLKTEKLGSEGRSDNSSDFFVVPSIVGEEELEWEELEDIVNGGDDERKKKVVEEEEVSSSKADLRKRFSAAEDDEDLTWDIEEDDAKH